VDLQQQQQLKQAWVNPEAFATTLLALFIDRYGTEGCDWEPEAILESINSDHGIDLPQRNFDRLMQAIWLLTRDDFFRSPADFVIGCNILSGDAADEEQEPPSSTEIAWGVTEAVLLVEPDGVVPFDPTVLQVMKVTFTEEGLDIVPEAVRHLFPDWKPATFDEWADDPEMMQVVHSAQREKTVAIDANVRATLAQMLEQISLLPLREGDASNVRRINAR
jgi:hypothetical protein